MRRHLITVSAGLATMLTVGILAAHPPARSTAPLLPAAVDTDPTAQPAIESIVNLPYILGAVSDALPGPTATPSPSATTTPSPTATSVMPTASATPDPLLTLAWERVANAPLNLYEAQGATVDDKLYVFGGFYNSLIQVTATSSMYDAETDSWTPIAAMPEALTHAGTAVVGELIYFAGGFVGDHPGPATDNVWIYNTRLDTWSAGPPLPDARAGGGLVLMDRTLHFFGGTKRQGYTYLGDYGDHWTLDLDGQAVWVPRAPMPNPRNHMAGVVHEGKVYAVGGQHLDDEINGNQSSVHAYDPATDSWSARADLLKPLGHIQCSTFVWRGQLIVATGITQGKEVVADVSRYDPGADRWIALTSLPRGFQSPVAGSAGDRILLSGSGETWIGTLR